VCNKDLHPYATQSDAPYAWYVLGVLTLIYTISFVDRQLLTLLFAPIKHDLHLSDTQVSLITGFAFAIFYALLGVPIATIADRHNRVGLIAAGMMLWSLMTTACGFVRTFGQFFLARVGVGIGETVLSPSAYSLIADYFPAQKLSRALSVYTLAIYAGMGAALVLGSAVVTTVMHLPPVSLPTVGTIHPWQLALMLVGTPGIILVAILFTIREPRLRAGIPGIRGQTALPESSLDRSALRYLVRRWRVYAPHFAGFSLLGMLGNGIVVWIPEFFSRRYGWPTSRTGMYFGIILMISGGPAVLLGGWYADRKRARGVLDAPIRVAITAIVPLGICSALMPNAPTPQLALALLAGVIFCFGVPGGLAPASIQMITPSHLRARVSAVYLFCTTFIGTGLGPTVVALLTDRIFRDEGFLGRSLTTEAIVIAPIGLGLMVATLRPFRLAVTTATTGQMEAESPDSSDKVRASGT